jgi:NTE family protein
MGLEPVWKSHAVVLVSDGGAVFDFVPDRGLLSRILRYTAIQGRQATAVRKRWLISSFISHELEGTYWGIGSAAESYGEPTAGYSKALVDRVVAEVRTDLDAFSGAETAVLENHGYLLADAAIRKHAPALVTPGAPPLEVPHRDWLDEAKISQALANSNRRRIFGRS